jgi:threonine aldolase
MEMNFRSDNESPASPEIMEALTEANKGTAWAYAEDHLTERLDNAFSVLFGTETRVLPLSTGTVANSIALASVTPPWGSVYCHMDAHILNDESGAPEFFGNGLRLVPMVGQNGRFDSDILESAVHANEGHGVHSYIPSAISITQSTEAGTIYQPDEINSICRTAIELDMATHLDGARFGNAVCSLGCHPGEITWRAGVQMMSFGASKNGCFAAEALLLFGETDLWDRAERLRKRSGHLLSKMRYISAQLLAYIDDDLWLRLAGNANQQASSFAQAVTDHPHASLKYPVEANEVFVRWSAEGFWKLDDGGFQFLMWPGRDDLARFVFSHSTSNEETEALCEAISQIEG